MRMHIPDKHLLVVRFLAWSHCGFVEKYRVISGPAEHDVRDGAYPADQDHAVLLAPGQSAEAMEAENAEDWSEQRYTVVRITNRDGNAEIETLDSGSLERID